MAGTFPKAAEFAGISHPQHGWACSSQPLAAHLLGLAHRGLRLGGEAISDSPVAAVRSRGPESPVLMPVL